MSDTFNEDKIFGDILYLNELDEKLINGGKNGDGNAINDIGEIFLKNLDYEKALICFRKASLKNNANAQNNMGYMYHKAQGVPEDFKLAFEWYKKAAEQHDITGCKNVAQMYENGHGISENKGWACHWYFKAVEKGDIDAMFRIGKIYTGWSDWNEALMWFRRAADRGHLEAKIEENEIYKRNVWLKFSQHAQLNSEKVIENLEVKQKELLENNKNLVDEVQLLTNRILNLENQIQKKESNERMRIKKLEELVAKMMCENDSDLEYC